MAGTTAVPRWYYQRHDEEFIARLDARAANLANDGYTVRPGDDLQIYLVSHPDKKGGFVEYTVDAYERTCTCPMFVQQSEDVVECKHLRGLEELIRQRLPHAPEPAKCTDCGGTGKSYDFGGECCFCKGTGRAQ